MLFVRQVLKAEPDSWQVEVLQAVAANQRVALKASKGPGKSTLLAWIGWWFLLTHLHPKVVCTSVTSDNLRDNLWTEFSKWQQKSEVLRTAFSWSAERIQSKDHPTTWWASARTWSKDADRVKQGEALAGIHADNVLFLVDEAGGVPDAVVATAEAGLANADDSAGRVAKLVIAGNPTELSGPLHRACTTERGLWWVKEISGDPDDPNRAPRVSIAWAREQIAKYGRYNPWVLVNVFGQFPPSQSNTLIGAELAGQAARRNMGEEAVRHEPRILGVDVARFGDDRTALAYRQGFMSFAIETHRNLDTMATADRVAWVISRWKPDGVFVDQTGIGAGVVDRLRQLGHYQVIGIDNASSPLALEPKLLNRRVEMWWLVAAWLRHGCIANDGELIAELTAPTFKFDAQQRLVLESKADLKKRGLPSPNKADALALTFAAPVHKRPEVEISGAATEEGRALGHDYDPYTQRRT